MPIYEYKCDKCRRKFEVLTKKPPGKKVEVCEKCGYTAQKIISQSDFHLKEGGVGWADKGYSNK